MEPDQIDMMDEAELRAELRRLVSENINLKSTIFGMHNDIGLAHDAAHERMRNLGLQYQD